MNPRRNVLFVLMLVSMTICFLGAELILHHLGHRPGVLMNYENFNDTNTLRSYTLYTDDEAGIYRLGPYVTDTLAMTYSGDHVELPGNVFADGLKVTEGVEVILRDFRNVLSGIDNVLLIGDVSQCEKMAGEGEFPLAACRSILTGSPDSAMYRDYLLNPFNSEGFRSIKLSHMPQGRPRIMLVGDSFVWGMSAAPLHNSYSDILLARGFTVYNMGIIGTDPAQYEAIVRKYVPLLRPDMVIVNFFLGNDLMPFERKVRAGMPPEHLTNLGFLDSHPLGKYLPPSEAYKFYLAYNRIPEIETRWFNKLCSTTNVLTKIWLILYEMGLVEHKIRNAEHQMHGIPDSTKAHITAKYLAEISKVCLRNDIPLINTVIPEKPFSLFRNRPFRVSVREHELLNIIYDGMRYHCPENLCANDYEDGGSHFNNKGSLKYADFLEIIIQNRLKNKLSSSYTIPTAVE